MSDDIRAQTKPVDGLPLEAGEDVEETIEVVTALYLAHLQVGGTKSPSDFVLAYLPAAGDALGRLQVLAALHRPAPVRPVPVPVPVPWPVGRLVLAACLLLALVTGVFWIGQLREQLDAANHRVQHFGSYLAAYERSLKQPAIFEPQPVDTLAETFTARGYLVERETASLWLVVIPKGSDLMWPKHKLRVERGRWEAEVHHVAPENEPFSLVLVRLNARDEARVEQWLASSDSDFPGLNWRNLPSYQVVSRVDDLKVTTRR